MSFTVTVAASGAPVAPTFPVPTPVTFDQNRNQISPYPRLRPAGGTFACTRANGCRSEDKIVLSYPATSRP